MAAPRPRDTLAMIAGSWKWVVASTIALARRAGSSDLKMPEPTNTRLGAELHGEGGVGRGGQATGAEERHGQLAGVGQLLHEPDRRLEPLGPVEELGRVGLGDLADVAEDRAQVPDGLDDVAGAGLALRPDHGGAFADATERLAEVGGAAHERAR